MPPTFAYKQLFAGYMHDHLDQIEVGTSCVTNKTVVSRCIVITSKGDILLTDQSTLCNSNVWKWLSLSYYTVGITSPMFDGVL